MMFFFMFLVFSICLWEEDTGPLSLMLETSKDERCSGKTCFFGVHSSRVRYPFCLSSGCAHTK